MAKIKKKMKKTLTLDYRFGSGKYKGYSISEILIKDIKYLDYLVSNGCIKVSEAVIRELCAKMNIKENKFIKTETIK